jgi:hypothetical protein
VRFGRRLGGYGEQPAVYVTGEKPGSDGDCADVNGEGTEGLREDVQ